MTKIADDVQLLHLITLLSILFMNVMPSDILAFMILWRESFFLHTWKYLCGRLHLPLQTSHYTQRMVTGQNVPYQYVLVKTNKCPWAEYDNYVERLLVYKDHFFMVSLISFYTGGNYMACVPCHFLRLSAALHIIFKRVLCHRIALLL